MKYNDERTMTRGWELYHSMRTEMGPDATPVDLAVYAEQEARIELNEGLLRAVSDDIAKYVRSEAMAYNYACDIAAAFAKFYVLMRDWRKHLPEEHHVEVMDDLAQVPGWLAFGDIDKAITVLDRWFFLAAGFPIYDGPDIF